ncbi:hypothetical protein Micbo1qcDRAFT_219063 [Microdochium bolleyi]|uniref:Uncharacterized protein n=1 Tax=Microdochium bolleyi TaxID=196109 RepID=A0A136INK1_9PEZI|nr:hypothetical protein Micbo1qcDRAFT_219063 [Microdochium bolleyi]
MQLQLLGKVTTYAVTSFLGWTGQIQDTPGESSLRQLNTLMHTHYTSAKKEALALAGPVIVADAFRVTLVQHDRRETVSYMDDLTNDLKAMAHVPLAITVVTQNEADDALFRLPEPKRRVLADYRAALKRASDNLDAAGFSTHQHKRQERIVQAADTALEALTSESGMSRAAFEAFANTTAPLAMDNVRDAAIRMLDAINAQVTEWRRTALAAEHAWAHLRVVVVSPHMPRRGALAGQYFERMMLHARQDPDGEGPAVDESRVLYMEDNFRTGVDSALNLLATHIVDSSVGTALLGDAGRLHRDILADAAARHLDEMDLPTWP